jgi:hypothetical protein
MQPSGARLLAFRPQRTRPCAISRSKSARRPGRDRLAGRVEVDEGYVDSERRAGVGHTEIKALLVVAVELEGR